MALRLQIHSHAHSPPLTPPPNLKYDLRKISNPPRQMRQAYDGRSSRLRDFMSHDVDFVRSRERAEREILDCALNLTKEHEHHGTDTKKHDDRTENEPIDAESADQEEGEVGSLGESEDETEAEGPVLRVSCFCAVGRHRSVAFAEELGSISWPQAWEVQVIHRDVDKSRLVKKFGRNGKERKGDRWRRDWPS